MFRRGGIECLLLLSVLVYQDLAIGHKGRGSREWHSRGIRGRICQGSGLGEGGLLVCDRLGAF